MQATGLSSDLRCTVFRPPPCQRSHVKQRQKVSSAISNKPPWSAGAPCTKQTASEWGPWSQLCERCVATSIQGPRQACLRQPCR